MNNDFIITKIQQVIFVEREKHKENVLHFSNSLSSCELIYHFSGESYVYFGDQVLIVKPNNVRFLPAGIVSKYEVVRSVTGECIDVFFETNIPISNNAFIYDASKKEQLGILFKKLFYCWIGKENGYYMKSMSYLYRIFAEMQNINYSKSDQYKLIEPAVDVINKEFLKSNLNSPYLAELCGISESYLKKIFNKKYGMPPKKYIIKKKMDYACELLRLERYSITQISEICNFKDVYYFSRQFKEYMGISPMDYVKRSKSRH